MRNTLFMGLATLIYTFFIAGCGGADDAVQAVKNAIDPQEHPENCIQEKDGFKSENGGCQVDTIVLAPLQTVEANQNEAIAACTGLQLNGYFDWSIPTADQLKTILATAHLKDDYNLNGAHLDGIPFFFTLDQTLDLNGNVTGISPNGTLSMENPNFKSPYFCVRVVQ